MDAWLDSLSEDWVSQPRSSSPSSYPKSVVSQPAESGVMNKSASRIPRRSSGSRSSITSTTGSLHPQPDKRRPALSERSKSEINKLFTPSPAEQGSEWGRPRRPSSSVSQSSAQGLSRPGTINKKSLSSSPQKSKKSHHTPEWKKRIIRGELGYGDQRDLFSPSGLENIFQPPVSAARRSSPKLADNQPSQLESGCMPSSPPPWPASPFQTQKSPDRGTARFGNRVTLCVLEEQEENHTGSLSVNTHALEATELSCIVDRRAPLSERPDEQNRTEDAAPTPNTLGSSPPDQGSIGSAGGRPGPQHTTETRVEDPITGRFNTIADEQCSQLGEELNTARRGRQVEGLSPNCREGKSDKVPETILGQGTSAKDSSPLREPLLNEKSDLAVSEISQLQDIGPFVDVKRGGYSAAGSFRRRALSPSSPPSRLPLGSMAEDSGDKRLPRRHNETYGPGVGTTAYKDFGPGLVNEEPPTTPRKHPVSLVSPQKPKSSGSPLKLFGDHDTFTNKRLLRRISQLEDEANGRRHKQHLVSGPPNAGVESRLEQSAGHADGDIFVIKTRAVKHTSHGSEKIESRKPTGSPFGQNKFDKHSFQAVLPADASISRGPVDRVLGTDSSTEGTISDHIHRFAIKLHSSPNDVAHLKSGWSSSQESSEVPAAEDTAQSQNGGGREVRSAGLIRKQGHAHQTKWNRRIPSVLEGKRPPTSPFKDPTPKRRRTSHKRRFDHGSLQPEDSVSRQHNLIQAAIGRRDTDASDGGAEVSSSEELTKRQMLRPRNPTPNQAHRQGHPIEHVDIGTYSGRGMPELEPLLEHIESTQLDGDPDEAEKTRQIAEEVAAFSFGVAKLQSSDRKRSVNTQDYLDEAMRIMHMIRNKGRPPSALDDVAEDSRGYDSADEDLNSEAASFSMSRPMSRLSAPNTAANPQFRSSTGEPANRDQELGELSEENMVSAFGNIALGEKRRIDRDLDGMPDQNCNIRIIEKSSMPHKRKHSTSSLRGDDPETIDTLPNSHKTHSSTDSSTGRTVATSRSQRSENVHTIPPDAVVHLIPPEVAGMSFDKDKQAWVKTKHDPSGTEEHETLSSGLHSEEDPLGKFPDLSINEVQEHDRGPSHEILQNLEPQVAQALEAQDRVLKKGSTSDQAHESAEAVIPISVRLSSQQAVDNGLTYVESNHGKLGSPKATLEDQQAPIDETGHSASQSDSIINERKLASKDPQTAERACKAQGEMYGIVMQGQQKPTTFACLTVRQGQPGEVEDIPRVLNMPHDPSELDLDIYDSDDTSSVETVIASHHHTPVKARGAGRPSSNAAYSKAMGGSTQSGKVFRTRSITCIDEGRVAYFTDFQKPSRAMSLAVSVLTPLPSRSMLPTSALSRRTDLTFQLTPLSEFTFNQSDEIRCMEFSYIGGPSRKPSGTSTKTSCPVATQSIVRTLTDVKPEEPFWEETQKLDLRNKSLTTLHPLDEFCPRTEHLDVSQNELTQLIGAPRLVRTLIARENLLSGLTSWGHLMNLQYLDVSGNKIESLEGFEELVHLRELRADDNMIDSLEGILDLDGLIKLSLVGNRLQYVDFEGANLKRLAELELGHNLLVEVHNLQCLPVLSGLNLDCNQLTHFPADDPGLCPMPKMRSLSIRSNRLSLLVMKFFPHVQSLNVDNNELDQILGIQDLGQLEQLSMREQTSRRVLRTERHDSLDRYYEVRKLYLSANPLSTVRISATFLNLQHLELASAGLQSLPPDLGRLAPNLRTLNLNMNAIEELHPLLGMSRLQTLLLAGNRITRLRRTGKLMGQFRALTTVDLRDNPLTLGFYPPRLRANHQTSQRPTATGVEEENDRDAGSYVLPAADSEHDEKYWMTLDENTKLRRRVYEKLLGSSCRNLKVLDGLVFDQEDAMAKDEIWERLLELGYVRRAAIE